MHEGSERSQRYCTNCGSQVSPRDAFCGSCGAQLTSGLIADDSPTREITQPPSERTGGYALPTLRFPGAGRDTLLAVLLALACAGLLVALIYAALAIRGAFSNAEVPATIGLALFALLHGGGASVDVPPIPSLFGLGGSIQLGLPTTSFALIPFLVSLLAGRLLGRHARTAGLFALVAALAYALLLAVLAALGAASSESGDLTIRFAPDPLSAAFRGILFVGLGAILGAAASRGPLLPAWARQVLRGALWAVGISLAITLVVAVVVGLVQQGQGTSMPVQQAPEALPRSTLGSSSVDEIFAALGAVFALLPIALGNLWLLAHGVPIGFQNAPDLSGIPLIGKALADVPLRVGLIGDWPWGGTWRMLLIGPVVGLLVGGMVAARGALPGGRWQQGALVSLPYAAIALLTAVLAGVSANVTLAKAANLEIVFRASLAWLLLLVPAGAVLGALGGLLTRSDAFPLPHPNRTFLITSAASGILVLLSLPVLLATLTPGAAQPAGPLASEGEAFSSQPSSGPPTPTPPAIPAPNEQTSPEPPEPEGTNSPADPAFDPLLPTLRQSTTAPIMLPADLPEELNNVAIDADQSGDRYGILSLYEPTGNVVESYVHANDAGTLAAAPEPPDTASEYFEATSEETVELPDGTEATLKYMEPKEGVIVNQGPFWEGAFEKEGYTYTLRVPLEDPSGEIARRALSSMVEVSGGQSASSAISEAAAEEAAEDYYRAVGVEDWDYTYDHLDSETRSVFTREEWFKKNQWLAGDGSTIYQILSVDLDNASDEPLADVAVELTYADGSTSIRYTYFVYEDGEWKHRFSQEEYDLFMPDLSYREFVAAQQ